MSKPGAFVLGYTGATGKALVQELSKDNHFKRIVLIGRRETKLDIENDGRFEQKVVDFDNLDKFEDAFKDCEAGFCCLGTTRATAGKEHFIKVDRDYVIKSAELAKSTGCKHFSLLTSQSSDKNSMFLYLQTKGQAEEGVKGQNFDRLSLFRPGLLIANRSSARIGETIYRCLLFPAKKIFPDKFSIPVEVLARGMLNNAKTPMTKPQEEFDNSACYRLSKAT